MIDVADGFTYPICAVEVIMLVSTQRKGTGPMVIAVGGGPGCGKTMLVDAVCGDPDSASEEFGSRELDAIRVPEAPTWLDKRRMWQPSGDPSFNKTVDLVRCGLEFMTLRKARSDRRRLVLVDRMVGEAVWVYTEYAEGESAPGLLERQACMDRYDAVILVGMPPKQVWDLHRGNNSARTEQTYEHATQIHDRIVDYVAGHRALYRVPNQSDRESFLHAGMSLIKYLVDERRHNLPLR